MANDLPPEDIRSVPAGTGGRMAGPADGPAWWGRHRPGRTGSPAQPGSRPPLKPARRAFPAAAEPPGTEQRESWPPGTAPGSGLTVLIVDDEPDVRRLLARQLMMAGYRVIEAADGNEALLRFLEPPRPELIVTDTRMPSGMSGIELIRRIRMLAPDQAILRISGMPNDPFDPAPPDIPFLAKPFRSDELLARVGELCRSVS